MLILKISQKPMFVCLLVLQPKAKEMLSYQIKYDLITHRLTHFPERLITNISKLLFLCL